MKMAKRSAVRRAGLWWKSRLFVAAIALSYVHAQDMSACCDKALGTCRSVCEKISLIEMATDANMLEESLPNIYKFCGPHLTEFWICMNNTIHDVMSGSGWWGRACCALGRSTSCRHACATARDENSLGDCRRSDEIPLFDCVKRQREAQKCCSQTQSVACHMACREVLWRVDQPRAVSEAKSRAIEECTDSHDLSQCLLQLTAPISADTTKYLSCCDKATSSECRVACERVLRRTDDTQEIFEDLTADCGLPGIVDSFWQCFLRKSAAPGSKDFIPLDVAKLHCCLKATTKNCRDLCYQTFNTGWQEYWQKFYSECISDPQELNMSQCMEEVEAPCSLGCSGLTYCSQMNNRPSTLFRSCNAQADLEAHMFVAEQKLSRSVTVAGYPVALKNSSQCPIEMWKSIACALHVKPCTPKGYSSLLCAAECSRAVSLCVEWGAGGGAGGTDAGAWSLAQDAPVSAHALCARLTPRDPAAPCVQLQDFVSPSSEPPLLTAKEAVTSPCAGSPCNATQVCVINRSCLRGGACVRYHCIDGCPLGESNSYIVPHGSWVRVPLVDSSQKLCFKICKCSNKALTKCQPLPCIPVENCNLHDTVILNGAKYYMECNACVCLSGERVCSRRACGAGVAGGAGGAGGAARLLTGLPCNCPPHHLPVRTPHRLFPNACLAKCAGATDAEIEFGVRGACASATCPRRHACLPAHNVCLSRLQTSCPQHVCVNTMSCNTQPAMPVCDTDGRTHANPCHLVMSGRKLAYWGQCLEGCSSTGTVCGVNGVTYSSECAAWAEYVSVDYTGPCLAVGPISDVMEPKCAFDRIICPPLKKPKCLGFTAPGACCPRCGGALRILYSKKQIDRALYGINISASVINLNNVLKALDRHVKIAECALRGYLTIETEIFVTIESLLQNPTDLQMQMCVLEAEKIADLINRESALITSDLGLSALSYALIVHSEPSRGAFGANLSILTVVVSYVSIFVLR
ncbi:reversion-inducing cysteine-rich protein with Kazal motifs [Manduca sexta]|uniref:reversion-inducing cysteine-rich protein with Kazal motifs n=1 Tax=Manduca sexta TaxID=7130 RepID=UPI001890AE7C|nr:reversion-inducing cysteine-rich protein with Kazal motifs [Manduca sexta]